MREKALGQKYHMIGKSYQTFGKDTELVDSFKGDIIYLEDGRVIGSLINLDNELNKYDQKDLIIGLNLKNALILDPHTHKKIFKDRLELWAFNFSENIHGATIYGLYPEIDKTKRGQTIGYNNFEKDYRKLLPEMFEASTLDGKEANNLLSKISHERIIEICSGFSPSDWGILKNSGMTVDKVFFYKYERN